MSKLGKKIFAILLILVISSLLLVSIFINFSIGERFNDFINLQREENINELSSMLSDNLKNSNFKSIIPLIENFSRTNRIPVWIKKNDGEFLFFSEQNNHMANMMRRMGMHNNRHMNMRTLPGDFPGENRSKDVYLKGEKVFTIYWKDINSENQIDSRLYNYFKNNVYKAIIFSALIVIFIVTILSFILSKKISDPLIKIKNAALDVSQGNYKQNIKIKGNDELSELSTAFNLMSKKLFKLEEIRKESASDLAHELRTPLTTIKGYLEAIEDGKLKANSENIKEMQEEAERMTDLIEKLNEFAEAQNKIFNFKKENINLTKLLNRVIKQQKKIIEQKSINLKIDLADNLNFRGDKNSLIQIFTNVIENAVKYNKKNGKIIIKSQKNKKTIKISIKDTGIGINKEDLPYIFERFYRADKSRNSKNQGSGIGLAVVKELLKAHQGEIKVKSSAEGTIFIIILPRIN